MKPPNKNYLPGPEARVLINALNASPVHGFSVWALRSVWDGRVEVTLRNLTRRGVVERHGGANYRLTAPWLRHPPSDVLYFLCLRSYYADGGGEETGDPVDVLGLATTMGWTPTAVGEALRALYRRGLMTRRHGLYYPVPGHEGRLLEFEPTKVPEPEPVEAYRSYTLRHKVRGVFEGSPKPLNHTELMFRIYGTYLSTGQESESMAKTTYALYREGFLDRVGEGVYIRKGRTVPVTDVVPLAYDRNASPEITHLDPGVFAQAVLDALTAHGGDMRAKDVGAILAPRFMGHYKNGYSYQVVVRMTLGTLLDEGRIAKVAWGIYRANTPATVSAA